MADDETPKLAATPTGVGEPVADTPAVVDVPVVDTPVADKPFSHTDTPSLLNTPMAKEEAEPVKEDGAEGGEATPEGDQTKEGEDAPKPPADDAEKPPAEPTEPPKEAAPPEPLVYDIKLPEGVAVDEPAMAAATDLFQKHRIDPAVAQEFVDLHAKELQNQQAGISDLWQHTFADTRKGWVQQVLSDPELGGAGYNTAMQKIFEARDLFVPERDQKAFNEFLDVTGAGDHPAFLRFIYRVASKFGTGTPAPRAQPVAVSKKDRNKAALYDSPAMADAIERNR